MNDKLKKTISAIGVLAALGLGGAALAGAQGGNPADQPAARSQAAQPAAGDTNAANEPAETNETEQKVTGPDADRAGQAALQSVGSGKVLSVEKETPEQGADKPEAGEKADAGEKPESAKEQAIDQKTAYSVEVQKSDGTTVDVALDSAFGVLSSATDTESAAEAPAQR